MTDNQRDRRPLGQHAGEVTKKKNRAANDGYGQVAAPPPPPSASQNGGTRISKSKIGQRSSMNDGADPDDNISAAKPRKSAAEQRAIYHKYAERRIKDSYHTSGHGLNDNLPNWLGHLRPSTDIISDGPCFDPIAGIYEWGPGFRPMGRPPQPAMITLNPRMTANGSFRSENLGWRHLPLTHIDTRVTAQQTTAQQVPRQQAPKRQLNPRLPLYSHKRTTGVATKNTSGAKLQDWRRGRIETWYRKAPAIPVYDLFSNHGDSSLTPHRLILAGSPAFSVASSTMCKTSPIWPASDSVPAGLMLYCSARSSREYFEWRPFEASDGQICAIYLEDMAGPELYYVLELETLTEDQTKNTLAERAVGNAAPGYLMHAESGKTFAFGCVTSTSKAVLPGPRSAINDESKDRNEKESADNNDDDENYEEDDEDSDEDSDEESEDWGVE